MASLVVDIDVVVLMQVNEVIIIRITDPHEASKSLAIHVMSLKHLPALPILNFPEMIKLHPPTTLW